jgi:hypothetical protein
VPEYATSLFSKSNTVTLVISLPAARSFIRAKLRTVAEAEEALGTKGGETITR